jgi:hypothetical protein
MGHAPKTRASLLLRIRGSRDTAVADTHTDFNPHPNVYPHNHPHSDAYAHTACVSDHDHVLPGEDGRVQHEAACAQGAGTGRRLQRRRRSHGSAEPGRLHGRFGQGQDGTNFVATLSGAGFVVSAARVQAAAVDALFERGWAPRVRGVVNQW